VKLRGFATISVVKKLGKLNIIKSKEIVKNLTYSIEINDSVAIDIN